MPIATVTSKGQITVPKAVREDLGLAPGSQVVFAREPDGGYRIERQARPVARLAGVLRHDGPAKTLDEMEQGIAEAVTEGYR
ncbi:MAG: AbrB/MazE/SpoVT family DNA-binding domain-containing protein [Micrococcales bacterium]|nr:AbrB/MazE/SpoVT family DNA-binding domain-containing protein [Micrococcales bacterium]